jgi:uncharacterized protein (TIGR02466 family)
MALDVWFPLTIYHADLEESAARNPDLLARIRQFRNEAQGMRHSSGFSWTGDVHDVDRLHLDPSFDWLTSQVEYHALEYLNALGHDLRKLDLYIQRAWPVIGQRGQRVARHAHPTAHFSAVYYVSVPGGEASGRIRFLNDHRPNELAAGIGSNNTGGYAEYNVFNYGSAGYPPVEGRLLLFPAKQSHEVDANETDEARISISFDMVLTSRGAREDGHHEFLMPPPSVWRRLNRAASDKVDGVESKPLAVGRLALTEVSRYGGEIDTFSIPDRTGHLLWETTVLRHCSSAAAWDAYKAALAEVPAEDWTRDHTGTIALWHGCHHWQAFQDAVDRLYAHLRREGIPVDRATIGLPVLQHRQHDGLPPGDGAFQRGKHHLCVYLRVDHEPEATASVEFADGSTFLLEPGALMLVSGSRRHRLIGRSHALHFQIDVPAVAREEVLDLRAFQISSVDDAVVFSVITAQPFTRPLPPAALLTQKINWRDGLRRRLARHADCPVVKRFLVEHADPASATPDEIDRIRRHGLGSGREDDIRLVEDVPALSAGQCEAVRLYAARHMTSVVPDTIDDLPEYQVDLSLDDLTGLVGTATVADLLKLPEALGAPSDRPAAELYQRIDIFARMYGPDMRPYIAFHADICSYTVNIALNEEASFQGGDLIALERGRLRRPTRTVGTALLHAGDLVHGVSRIEHGVRFSLILFFTQRA